MPRPVEDLAAVRKGDRVTLTWSAPVETTDRDTLRASGSTAICRSVSRIDQCIQVGAERVGQSPQPKREFVDTLPRDIQEENATGFVVYALESRNARGQSGALSNRVQVPLAPTLSPPQDLRASVGPEGITLTWSGELHTHETPEMRHRYRLYRREAGSDREAASDKDVIIGELFLRESPTAELLDRNFEWEKTYHYKLAVVTVVPRAGQDAIEVEGDDSPAVEVLAHDAFPPAVPQNVQAVFAGPPQNFIDLTWTPVTDAGLAGYNVYRRDPVPPHQRAASTGDPGEYGPPRKLNAELVKAPAFRDARIERGQRYLYSVSAVDLRGNQSAKSDETGETVP
ncbi:MAG: fibronectin type III domain-containing protein [Burkholderiales bacterium]